MPDNFHSFSDFVPGLDAAMADKAASADVSNIMAVVNTKASTSAMSARMLKSNNLSDVADVPTSRANLGLGTLATQNGTFSGASSGTNTGDQSLAGLVPTTRTVNGHALSGNVTVTLGDLGVQTALVEKDFGVSPKLSGSFTVNGFTGLTSLLPVSCQQAALPYTGKGTLSDEAEMDSVSVAASVLNSTTIQAFWNATGFVAGNFKFFVRIGV